MNESMRRARTALSLLLLAACGTMPEKTPTSPFAPPPDPNEPPPTNPVVIHKPWTVQFVKPAILVAQEIEVEGPIGLFDHFVTTREEMIQDVEEKTTSAGYRQTITLKPGAGAVEIRAQLDELRFSALRKLSMLERPGPVDVVVVGRGDAWWRETGTSNEQRGASLRFVGQVRR